MCWVILALNNAGCLWQALGDEDDFQGRQMDVKDLTKTRCSSFFVICCAVAVPCKKLLHVSMEE